MLKASLVQLPSKEKEQARVYELDRGSYYPLAAPVSAFHQSGMGLIIVGQGREALLMNKEAWFILAKGKVLHPSKTDFLKVLPRAIYQSITQKQGGSLPIHRGVFQSGQRRYSVWTAPIFKPNGTINASTTDQTMVILERIPIKNPHLPLLIRKFRLTPREGQVVKLLFDGKSDKLIGLSLGLSVETIRGHMKHIRSKMGATSRLEIFSFLTSV